MKPKPAPTTYDVARAGRAEAALSGAGVTLLVIGVILLGLLLLVVAPALYDQLQTVLGSGVQQLRTLSFLATAGGGIFMGGLIFALLFAFLLSRTGRPGVALFVEGLLAVGFLIVLIGLLTAEVREALTGLLDSLRAGAMQHLPPLQ
jgi:hypothetical protein